MLNTSENDQTRLLWSSHDWHVQPDCQRSTPDTAKAGRFGSRLNTARSGASSNLLRCVGGEWGLFLRDSAQAALGELSESIEDSSPSQQKLLIILWILLTQPTEAGTPYLAFEMWALFPKGTFLQPSHQSQSKGLQPMREISIIHHTALNLKHLPIGIANRRAKALHADSLRSIFPMDCSRWKALPSGRRRLRRTPPLRLTLDSAGR